MISVTVVVTLTLHSTLDSGTVELPCYYMYTQYATQKTIIRIQWAQVRKQTNKQKDFSLYSFTLESPLIIFMFTFPSALEIAL